MSENTYKFQKLTPVTDVEMDIYEDAMKYVFSNNDIRNIAISGAYGAGKSSVIETYKAQHKGEKFLHISLAHFENKGSAVDDSINIEISDNEINDKETLSVESVLEGKILNQLIHQIKPASILQTNFSIKKEIDKKFILLRTFEIVLFFFLSFFIKFNNKWLITEKGLSNGILKSALHFTTTNEMLIVAAILWLILLARGLHLIIKTQVNKNIFKRINVKGNEIEIFEDKNDSYFDKYLNEVLYLFENAGSDNIVFEDMDRYDTNLIFEKLREINTLLNRRKDLLSLPNNEDKKESIRFFYLLRDDIFLSKDRTKFFDFILPVVPIVDASNAYDKFIEHFKDGNIFQLFDEKFMQGLSLYVDDMRLLKNIYNEFIIYYNRLKKSSTEQNPNKLLAMITYKNIFPRDFADLQISQGYVYTLFDKKEEFQNNEIAKIQHLIEEYEDEIIHLEKEVCSDINELDAIYFCHGLRLRVDGVEETNYTKRSEFIAAIKQNNYNVYANSPHSGWYTIDVRDYFKKISQNKEYVERKLKIENAAKGKVESNKSETIKLKIKQDAIKNCFLKELVNRDYEKAIFQVSYENELNEVNSFEEIKRSPYFPLIKYLIKNGYIDETYPDYMTYFYENSISRIDKVFLRSITDNDAKQYQYKLVNPKLIISRMRDLDFKVPESLNYSLLDYLLQNNEIYTEQLSIFLSRIRDEKIDDFVLGYLLRNIERETFTKGFNIVWDNACCWIVESDKFPVETKKTYIIDTFCVSAKEIILANNRDSILTEFISNNEKFLEIENTDIKQLISGFLSLEVKFIQIDYLSANTDLFEAVYQNNLYEINFSMIDLILDKIYKIEKSDDYVDKTMTLIMINQKEQLCQYIKDNIDVYMSILLERKKLIYDEEDTALFIINNTDIEDDDKIKYIQLLQTPIRYLEEIDDKSIWTKMVSEKKIEFNQKNIFDYYFLSGKGMDDALVIYINNYPEVLSIKGFDLDDAYGEKSESKIFNSIIQSNEMDDDKYIGLVTSLNRIYNKFPYHDVKLQKVALLIDSHIITMTSENLQFMRTNHKDLLFKFIKDNIEKYTGLMAEDLFLSEELLQLLASEIDDKYKIELLSFESNPISVKKCNYTENVIVAIINNNFDKNDIPYLLTWYPAGMPLVQEGIEKIVEREIATIIDEEYKMKLSLLSKILTFKTITKNDKKLILSINLPNLEIEVTKKLLEIIGATEFIPLLYGKRPKYEKTTENKRLLSAFEKRGWITRFEEDKDDINSYRAFGRQKFKGKGIPVQLL
ncbi:YobI family P-loop NTPase [Anaerocolumna sp.]|uniref:YobI family P-loop NTPase n=1 Tax=Anaerocolumna sp. TaxID=2041569 RepID=UPI0028B109C2|nr:hypothetical protein [Anaerocolumna sp.]